MENKLIEQPSSSQVQAPCLHWTTSLCKMLLLSQIFLGVLVALVPALSLAFPWSIPLLNGLTYLFLLIGITLCIMSCFATFFTRKPHWSPGKRIARIGLLVGGLQTLFVLTIATWAVLYYTFYQP